MSDIGFVEVQDPGNGRFEGVSGRTALNFPQDSIRPATVLEGAVNDRFVEAANSKNQVCATAVVPSQSGLSYVWQNGKPLIPVSTKLRSAQIVGKRVFDVIIASSALIVILPLLLMVAAMIKLTSQGPVLFKQSRVGENGRPFDIFKFRSMRIDDCDLSGVNQTLERDQRTTAIGRFIRNKSIDELPQLLNVLIGNMSLVGPRPHVPGMLAGGKLYEDLVPYYALRHAMKPGITGWAQANGYRGPTGDAQLARARVDHDLAYIQNFSLWLDLVTLVRTIWREMQQGTGV